MDSIIINKQQSKEIARVIYSDVKSYCTNNLERYFSWYIDDMRKSKGKPPLLEPIRVEVHPCVFCDMLYFTEGLTPKCKERKNNYGNKIKCANTTGN